MVPDNEYYLLVWFWSFEMGHELGTHNVITIHDHRQRLAVIGLLKGGRAAHEHVEDNTQTPNI